MKKWLIVVAMVGLGTMTACGGDVCEEAEDIIKDKCGSGVTIEGECTGDDEDMAQCIVDNDDKNCEEINAECSGG